MKENSLAIVMYHYVRDLKNSRYPEIKGFDISEFKAQIEFFKANYKSAMKENSLAIVMYHYVRDLKNSRYPEIKGFDISEFKAQIEFFKANYNIITMEQLISAITPPPVNLNVIL